VITIEEAIEIAVRCHKGQVDKSGKPYILHPPPCNVKNENRKRNIPKLRIY